MSNTYLCYTVIFSQIKQKVLVCVFCLCTYVCISVGYLSAVMHACPWVGVGMRLCE